MASHFITCRFHFCQQMMRLIVIPSSIFVCKCIFRVSTCPSIHFPNSLFPKLTVTGFLLEPIQRSSCHREKAGWQSGQVTNSPHGHIETKNFIYTFLDQRTKREPARAQRTFKLCIKRSRYIRKKEHHFELQLVCRHQVHSLSSNFSQQSIVSLTQWVPSNRHTFLACVGSSLPTNTVSPCRFLHSRTRISFHFAAIKEMAPWLCGPFFQFCVSWLQWCWGIVKSERL